MIISILPKNNKTHRHSLAYENVPRLLCWLPLCQYADYTVHARTPLPAPHNQYHLTILPFGLMRNVLCFDASRLYYCRTSSNRSHRYASMTLTFVQEYMVTDTAYTYSSSRPLQRQCFSQSNKMHLLHPPIELLKSHCKVPSTIIRHL